MHSFCRTYEREKAKIRKKHYEERLILAGDILAQAKFAADAMNSWDEFNCGESGEKQRLIREMRDVIAEATCVKKLIDEGDDRCVY
jgi:hypothetical protein